MRKPKLPRGLYLRPRSPFLYFSYRDARNQQHTQSTETADVNAALLYKLQFLQKLKENPAEVEIAEKIEDLGKLPLKEVAERYFNWKRAKSSDETLARERRLFKKVLKFFGPNQRVKVIQLPLIQKYQGERCLEKSPTMKRRVCARTINYELQLLRGSLKHAGCWTDTLEANYEPLPQRKSDIGQAASVEQLKQIILKARMRESWAVAICCAAVAMGTGCRGGEIRKLQIQDIRLEDERIVIRKENAKNGKQREPRLTGLAIWGLRNLLLRAKALGATEPTHYLLPLNLKKSRILAKTSESKWDVTRPMTTWVKSWRQLMKACEMQGFRFHDLRHSFRTIGAEAGVPLEVMMTQVGHMDRQTSLDYVHIQQRALERAKAQIETHQAEILAATETLLLADNAFSFLPAQ